MRTILLFFWLDRWQCSKAKDRYSSAAGVPQTPQQSPPMPGATPTLTQGPKAFRGDNVSHQH